MVKRRTDGQMRDVRFDMFMSKKEFDAIDDWRFENRIGSRGEAVRQLVELGLDDKTNMVLALTKQALHCAMSYSARRDISAAIQQLFDLSLTCEAACRPRDRKGGE